MSVKLTNNAISDIFNEQEIDQPIIQVINIKPLNPNSQDRFRAFISDGINHTGCAMFGTQLNDKVKSSEIDINSVIKLLRFVCNTVNASKKIIIILECEVLVPGVDIGEMIGSPTVYDPKSISAQTSGQNTAVNVSMPVKEEVKQAQGIHPIASLTPYQNKWKICVRVTNKSNIRSWNNSRGEGTLFSMDLLDESGEIRATAFKDQCDKFYNMIEVDKVYFISQAQLKTANKQFSSLKNDYEMTFTASTEVTSCHEETNIPVMQFEFINIEKVENLDKDQIIDTIGICKSFDDVVSLTQKTTGKELRKRDIQIVDDSGKEIKLTLWGTEADEFDGKLNPVVAIKGCRISDFRGKSLSVMSSSVIQLNPDIREAHKLRAWYDNFGSSLETVNISNQSGFGDGSNFKSLGQAIAEGLGCGNAPDYYSVKATITHLRSENSLYAACPSDNCNKKVVDQNNGIYRCEKCNREYDSFKWRLILSASIADCTDNTWVTIFQESAETILGYSASDLASKKEMDANDFLSLFQTATFKEYIFKLRVNMDNYNDESRLRTNVISIVPLNPVQYSQRLCEEIKNLVKN